MCGNEDMDSFGVRESKLPSEGRVLVARKNRTNHGSSLSAAEVKRSMYFTLT